MQVFDSYLELNARNVLSKIKYDLIFLIYNKKKSQSEAAQKISLKLRLISF